MWYILLDDGTYDSSASRSERDNIDESPSTSPSTKTTLPPSCEERTFSNIIDDYRSHKSTRLFVSQAVRLLDWTAPSEQIQKLNEILPKGETILLPHNEDGNVDMLVMTTPSEGEIFILNDSLEPPPCRTTTELRAIFSLSKDEVDRIFMGLSACWASCTVELIQLEMHISLAHELPNVKTYRRRCMHYLRLLSMRHRVLPPSFILNDIIPEGQHPVWGGGFADVWRGSMGGQPVCLKVLRFFITRTRRDKLIKQLCREALAWRQLSHPHVLPFLGVSTELFAPSFCLVSPWMSNGNLMVYLEANPDFDRLKALLEVAVAMVYLHEQDPSVVHGDIRGANILVTDDLRCCLSDFGLATVVESLALDSSSVNNNGSVRWMAPELLLPTVKVKDGTLAKPSGSVHDVYAFGCTFLEIWTGKPPFHNYAFEAAVCNTVVAGQRPARPPQIPSDTLWSLIERCWVQDPVQRPSAQEIVLYLNSMVFTSDMAPAVEEPPTVRQHARLRLHRSHAQNQAQDRHPAISIRSLPSYRIPEHRERIRTATSILCAVILRPPYYVTWSGYGDWQQVEVRVRRLARLERRWTKFSVKYPVENGISAVGEERERSQFCEALQDGYVLCHLMNKLRSSPIIKPDPRKGVSARIANVSNFLAACSSYGLPNEALFHCNDLTEATPISLGRVAKTIIALIKFAGSDSSSRPLIAPAPSSISQEETIDDLFIQFLVNLPARRSSLHISNHTVTDFISIRDQPVVTSHPALSSSSTSHPQLNSTQLPSPRPWWPVSEWYQTWLTLCWYFEVVAQAIKALLWVLNQRMIDEEHLRRSLTKEATSEMPFIPGELRDTERQQLVEEVAKPEEAVPAVHLDNDNWLGGFLGHKARSQIQNPSPGSGEGPYSTSPRRLTIVDAQQTNKNLEVLPRPVDASPVGRTLIVHEEGKLPMHFQLGDCIGTGQFGPVSRALNLTGQTVAVKRIRLDSLKEKEVAALVTAVDLVKSLSHPSIVKYEGIARDGDTLNIVLEYVEGGSLRQILTAFGKLPKERLVVSFVTKIMEGLHYLHQHDVVHGNLKAANILTTKNGDIKLSDFGVSLSLCTAERDDRNLRGAPNWMAPEVIKLRGASPKSDIWSLACTVIELLTGKPPFAHITDSMIVMLCIVGDDMPIPESCSPSLLDFLNQCFNKDPTKRPSAEILCEHDWLRKNRRGHQKEAGPQDSNPSLRHVGTEVQKSDAVRYVAQTDIPDSSVGSDTPRPDDVSSGSPPGTRLSNNSECPPLNDGGTSFQEHNFVETRFSEPMVCRVCQLKVKKNAVLCAQCSLISHSKCASNAPPICGLRCQLLLYSEYTQRGNRDRANSNLLDNESLPIPTVSYGEQSPRTSLIDRPTSSLSPVPGSAPSTYKIMGAVRKLLLKKKQVAPS